MPSQNIISRLAEMHADARDNVLMNATIKDAAEKTLKAVEDDKIKLKVNKVWVDNKRDNKDVAAQQEVRLKGQTWGNDLRADLSLIDKESGKEIDRVQSIKLANIPKITDRGTYLTGGNEYQFTKQSRLKPGVYTKRQTNGEISSFFNVDKTVDFDRGFNNNFKINFNPEKRTFTMGYGAKNVPLYNALHAVGVTDKEMKEAWGEEVYAANEKAYGKHENKNQAKLYSAIFGRLPDKNKHKSEVEKEIKERLFQTELDEMTTGITLGKSYKNVGKGPLIDASKKIIGIHRGDVEPDDREALIFKSFYGIEDHTRERLVKNSGKIIRNAKMKLKRNKKINQSISTQTFDPFVTGTITSTQLSNPPNQTNPMSIIGESSKVTVMGEGGIGTANAVTNETRQISNSEAGFLDPLHTPEGGQIGVSLHTSMDTIKVDNDLYAKFKTPAGKTEFLRPIDVYDKNLAFPDQYKNGKPKNSKVKVIKAGKMTEVSPKDVDVIISSAQGMFDTSSNSIPFLDSIQGNRGLTAAKMQEQALSLTNRDKPGFAIMGDEGKPLATTFGSVMGLPMSPVAGEIIDVTKKTMTIKDKKGKKHDVQLYDNFSLNSESFIDNTPVVKVGDKVSPGDILADNNFTKDGQMSLGANLRVAYMPYKGYNYEDSAIMSESAAEKLTSQHMYDLKTKRSSKGVFSKDKFKAYYPEDLTAKNAAKLDKEGVVKKGQIVERGDVVIAHMEKSDPSADDIAVGRLDKQLRRDMSNKAVVWENDNPGVITSVQKHGNSVAVNVKTKERFKEADKISGLHGNKHIVSKIVPDSEMPFDPKTGKHIELTMSPIGVTNRINTSQLLENAAGKIAEKTGKQYEINNFSDVDNSRKIMDDLKAAGLSDKDVLVDPDTGKPFINPVANGVSHILKLEHKVDHKYSARYKDGYDANEQAVTGGHTGGKNLGRMEMSALLARGATENLKEAFQIKGQRNDDFWRAMETGQSLPPPKDSFVWDKMLSTMSGAGINVEQKGKTFTLKPMTDKEVLARSKGELLKPYETYRKKDLAPMREGLFDPVKAGGMQGDHYTHFKLDEKILNPITSRAVASMLEMPMTKLDDVINGRTFVAKKTGELVPPGTKDAISGGPAIEILMKKIDVDGDLAHAKEMAEKATKKPELDKYHKKIRFLKALKDNDMKPQDYMMENILVTPSKYRPMFSMGTDSTVIMSDINDLYQQASRSTSALKGLKKDLKEFVPDEDIRNLQLAESRGQLYQDVRAIVGLQEPTSFIHRSKNKKGFITQIDGGKKQTKTGFFQDKVLERRQDLVGRSTIILNPDLGGDEIGIPATMATEMFQPFIMKKLVGWGYKPLEAQKLIRDKSPVFERARQVVADERLVIANRAPTLHRYSMTAFNPRLTDGKSIEVPSTALVKNFGADIDGDSNLSNIPIVININDLREYVSKGKKVLLGEKYCIDSSSSIAYIKSIIKQMEINMPYVGKMLTMSEDDIVTHIHIKNFPRDENAKKVNEENGNEDYDVPRGVECLTLDNSTHEFKRIKVEKFSIHKNLVNYSVDTSSGDNLLLSSDQSAVAVNRSNWEIEKVTPEELKGGLLMPKVRKIEIEPSIFKIGLEDYSDKSVAANRANPCKSEMILDRKFGWLLGAMIGDGWVSLTNGNNQICIASIHESIGSEFEDVINSMLDNDAKRTIVDSPHEFEGNKCFSRKHTISSSSLAKNFVKWIGRGAANKHLPPFYMAAPEEFRLGLLSGLIDTDGSANWNKKKVGRQFSISYSSISEVLATEVVSLCRSLGISASITIGNKSTNGLERRVVVSTVTAHGKDLRLKNELKSKNLQEFNSEPVKDSSVLARLDIVPFSSELFIISKEFIKWATNKNLYGNINDAKRNNWRLSRRAAKFIIAEDVDNKLPERWKEIVANEDVTWVYAKKVTLNKERVDMYDITAPGPYTFMLDNGIIVQDTFTIHTPVSAKALKEAEGMKPSASMLKTGYDTVLNAPSMDMVIGTWLASKGMGGKTIGTKYKNIDEARQSFRNNNITYGDTVTIDGKKATFGMHEINSSLPTSSQKWDVELDDGNVNKWIKEVTKSHNGKIALGLADRMKEVGNSYVTKFGYSIGASDTLSDKEVQGSIIKNAKTKLGASRDPDKIVSAYFSSLEKGKRDLAKKHGSKTTLGIGIQSGGSKGIGNTAAISLMPGIVTDANDVPIAMPITKSYSEGLDSFQYWSSAHGARGGNIKKSVSSFMPGWMTKDIMNSIYETRISGEDPVDKVGLEYSVTDSKGIANRYLARDAQTSSGKVIAKRNEVVDSDTVNKLVKGGIKSVFVQSPLTDPSPGDGFSSYSYGADYNGKRHNTGDNIGIMSAHTLTEPSLNLAMKSFHTGGALQKNKSGQPAGTVFDRLWETLKFTRKIPDKATVSSMNGIVSDISKSSIGGWDVVIKDKDKEAVRYVDTNNKLSVSKGDRVKAGDRLSTGTVSVHDTLKYKGMPEVQKFLVKEISDINENKLDKRDIETVVRGITNTTRVLHPGSSNNYVSGDVAQLSSVNNYNSSLKEGQKSIKHEPFLTPTGIQAKASASEDWIARMAHNRIKRVLEEGTTQGWKSNIDPNKGNPISRYVTGEY